MRPHHTTLLAIPALLTVSAACDVASIDDDATRGSNGEIVEPADVGALQLRLGDCIESLDASFDLVEVVTLGAVPCSQPHQGEVYARFDLSARSPSAFPGEDEVFQRATEGCDDHFEGFVGQSYAESVYDVYLLFPNERAWDMLDDRSVTCIVTRVDGVRTTGSAKASGL